jgi:carboxymethylenebutenolidase
VRNARSVLLPFAALLIVVAVISAFATVRALSGGGKPSSASARRPSSDTSRVHIGPATGGTTAFVAWPAGSAAAPGVIVVHEWWGLNGQIRDVARRLAREGYVAVVPDLYHGAVADDPEKAHELMRGLEDDAVLADLDGTVAWLRAQPATAKSRLAVVGFCVGGRYSELLDLHSDALSAAVMFYGPPEIDPKKLATLKAPLQGHFGTEDQGIPVAKVESLRAGLHKAGKEAEVYVYAGAGHAFMHDGRPSYHPDAARQAWARTLGFLQKHLKY